MISKITLSSHSGSGRLIEWPKRAMALGAVERNSDADMRMPLMNSIPKATARSKTQERFSFHFEGGVHRGGGVDEDLHRSPQQRQNTDHARQQSPMNQLADRAVDTKPSHEVTGEFLLSAFRKKPLNQSDYFRRGLRRVVDEEGHHRYGGQDQGREREHHKERETGCE